MSIIKKRELFFDGELENKIKRESSWAIHSSSYLIRPLAKIIFRYTVIGKENIPKEGGAIIAANHVSLADPFFLMAALRPRILRILAKKSLFVPMFGGLLARNGAIPVQQDSADRTAVKRSAAVIKNGELLGIFPEGTRMNSPEKEYKPHAGLVLIANMAKCDIIPVGLVGTDKIKPYNKHFISFPKVTINIGKPISLDDYIEVNKKERTQKILDDTMNQIFSLRDEVKDK